MNYFFLILVYVFSEFLIKMGRVQEQEGAMHSRPKTVLFAQNRNNLSFNNRKLVKLSGNILEICGYSNQERKNYFGRL